MNSIVLFYNDAFVLLGGYKRSHRINRHYPIIESIEITTEKNQEKSTIELEY